jgi:hypothetical protein
MALGVNVKIVAIGRKCQQYMKRRPKFQIISEFAMHCIVQRHLAGEWQ